MKTKTYKVLVCLLIASLLLTSCGQKVRIVDVERVDTIGYEGMAQASPRPGNTFLLIELKTSEELSSSGSDLVLKDDQGNSYPGAGLFSGKYIFEVPLSADNFTLIVKDSIELPLP